MHGLPIVLRRCSGRYFVQDGSVLEGRGSRLEGGVAHAYSAFNSTLCNQATNNSIGSAISLHITVMYSSDKSTVCSGTEYSTHSSHAQDIEVGREKPEHSSSNCKKGFQPTLANSL